MNHKKVYRLYREANLAVGRRKKVRRPPSERQSLSFATTLTTVWSMDLVSDALANLRHLKWLTVADSLTHECVDITVDHAIYQVRPTAAADAYRQPGSQPAPQSEATDRSTLQPGLCK